MKILITADSTCCLSKEEAARLHIPILPLNIIVDEVEYHDGVDIDQEKLIPMMRGGAKISTSTPTPFEMESFFDQQFAKDYDHIIHFTISSKLSSIYSMFTTLGKEKYGDKLTVVDSLSVCRFMGNLVLHAKKLADLGKNVQEILDSLQERISTEDVYFTPESMEFLKRGGRVSPAVATIGNLLGIKPILRFKDGSIEKSGTTRTIKKAVQESLSQFKSKNYDPSLYEVHVLYFDSIHIIEDFEDEVKKALPNLEIIKTPISINVCAHAGPGTIGIGVVRKP